MEWNLGIVRLGGRRRIVGLAVMGMCFLVPFLLALAVPAPLGASVRPVAGYGDLPLGFEENRGQADRSVRFLSRAGGHTVFLTDTEAVLLLPAPRTRIPEAPAHDAVLRMALVGGRPDPRVTGLDPLPGVANYLIGNDPAKWRTGVPNWARVRFAGVYPGVDLVYHGDNPGRRLEYDFVVAPGADPRVIQLAIAGADRVRIDPSGDLVISVGGREVRFESPVVYQERDGTRTKVRGAYVLRDRARVAFRIGAYDRTRPLVIDPVLAYSTYLGGGGADSGGAGIAVDAAGNAYLLGETNSTNFPVTAGAFDSLKTTTERDAFVAKLNPSGTAVVWATYLGGSGYGVWMDNIGDGIAVDASGNVFVVGRTASLDFPTTPGAYRTAKFSPDSSWEGFLVKLDAGGAALVYSTFLGGLANPEGLAIDADGNAFVAGIEWQGTLPTTSGAFQRVRGGGQDAFVMKVNPEGTGVHYSTYLGGSGSDSAAAIAVDDDGNAYVVGGTSSANFPVTPGAFDTVKDPTVVGGYLNVDAFVAKLNPTGSALVYSTFLGGSASEVSGIGRPEGGIALDASGAAYVTGVTQSANFPTTPGALQPALWATYDTFVTKLSPDGSELAYSTYLGGGMGSSEPAGGIVVDGNGIPYVTGYRSGYGTAGFPLVSPLPQGSSGYGIFVSRLNATGTRLFWSTFLSRSGTARVEPGIALDPEGAVYVSGTAGSGFTTSSGAVQPAFAGGNTDAFVVKLAANTPPTAVNDRFEVLADGLFQMGAPGFLANDADADGDVLEGAVIEGPLHGTLAAGLDGSFTYIPEPGFIGTDTFTYVGTDGAFETGPGTVELVVDATWLEARGWGSNNNGQLGDGTLVNRVLPVDFSDLETLKAVAGGEYHSMVLKADGTVWTVGDNLHGQIGDGTTTDRLVPFQVPVPIVSAVAAGSTHSLALGADGDRKSVV
mgnify:CR=1 FL=1